MIVLFISKHFFYTERVQSFTSLNPYHCQDIKEGFEFIRCLNGTGVLQSMKKMIGLLTCYD